MSRINFSKKTRLRAASLLIAAALACSPLETGLLTAQEVSAASVPDQKSTVSEANIQKLLSAYDKDGAYLTKYALDSDGSFFFMLTTMYFSPDAPTEDTLDTVSHEAFHEFAIPSYWFSDQGSERIYIGNKKSIKVNFTDVYPSKEMAKSVPKRCRTAAYHYESGDRFKTYIVDVSGNQRSDVDGVYGLLNEFGGYCWGMNSNNKLYSYRDKFDDNFDTWESFISEGESDRLAYAEFKYYILHYMYYAKQHHPDIYRKILANAKFRKAYRLTERRFAKEISDYDKKLTKVQEKLRKGANINLTNDKLILRKQYNVMTKEVKKKQYADIQKALTK